MARMTVLIAGALLIAGTGGGRIALADAQPRAHQASSGYLAADSAAGRLPGSAQGPNLVASPSPTVTVTATPSGTPLPGTPAYALLTPAQSPSDSGASIFSGGGFTPFEAVTFQLGLLDPFTGKITNPVVVITGSADAQGGVSYLPVSVPSNLAAGLYAVQAMGLSSGRLATTLLPLPLNVVSSGLLCPTFPLSDGSPFSVSADLSASGLGTFVGGTSVLSTVNWPTPQHEAASVDSQGNFTAFYSVPPNVPDGLYRVIVGGVQNVNGANKEGLRSCSITVGFGGVTATPTPMASATATPIATTTNTPQPFIRQVIVVHGRLLKERRGAGPSPMVVGSFSDPAGLPPTTYQAVIDWGDGSPLGDIQQASAGHLVPVQGSTIQQVYVIIGSHSYTHPGTYPIDITISAMDGRVAYLTSIAQVSGAGS
jgi:hypothetical protein